MSIVNPALRKASSLSLLMPIRVRQSLSNVQAEKLKSDGRLCVLFPAAGLAVFPWKAQNACNQMTGHPKLWQLKLGNS
jgi:hypothetical protein